VPSVDMDFYQSEQSFDNQVNPVIRIIKLRLITSKPPGGIFACVSLIITNNSNDYANNSKDLHEVDCVPSNVI
jgi:hypothetical protein